MNDKTTPLVDPLVRHCRSGDYNYSEQRQTCVACAHPLADNQLVAILHDMAKDRGDGST